MNKKVLFHYAYKIYNISIIALWLIFLTNWNLSFGIVLACKTKKTKKLVLCTLQI